MTTRKKGERVLIGHRIAVVLSTSTNGLQLIRYEDGRGLLFGYDYWPAAELAQMPQADAPRGGGDA